MGITTDFIVGFPEETEADFEETLLLVREVEFDNAFIFKYSVRRDTPAAAMPEQVPQEVKEERNARLRIRLLSSRSPSPIRNNISLPSRA